LTMLAVTAESDIEKFIARWSDSSGNECANFQHSQKRLPT